MSSGKVRRLNELLNSLGFEDPGVVGASKSHAEAIAEEFGGCRQNGHSVFPRCDGKISYPSRGIAIKVRRNRMRASGMKLVIYHCDSCGGFHLTSSR